MSIAISPTTLSSVVSTLDAYTLQQQVHAHNIANAGVPNFRAHTVSFRSTLTASAIGGQGSFAREPVVVQTQDTVSLPTELALMSQSAVDYQALVKLLNRHYSIAAVALNDGKR